MTRNQFIEMALRQIYGGQPSDDADISFNLVNVWLNQGTAIAAKANYKDNNALDGIGYVNNGFYTTYKGLVPSLDSSNIWKIELPEIPVGVGYNEGISKLKFMGTDERRVSLPCVPLTENQTTIYERVRTIPNRVLFYQEGKFIYAVSTILLNQYTAQVTMISGGDSNNLDSELNVPYDYFPVIVEYIKQQLQFERMQPQDVTNDGSDAVKTT